MILIFIIIIIISLCLLLIGRTIYNKFTTGWDRSHTCLIGKTALVTGADRGIGFYTALDFAKRGARVILVSKYKKDAEDASEKIIKITGNPNILPKQLEATSFDSVRAFAKNFNETEERLDILVNNMGILTKDTAKTIDGCNIIMQVNYYSGFLLTHLLIDKLKASAPSRIVNVASSLYKKANLNPNDLDRFPKGSRPYDIAYKNSKLGIICFTMELSKRLEGTGVITNAVHPGFVNTNIFDEIKGFQGLLISFLNNFYTKTPLEGAQTSIYVAVSPEVENVSGKYFVECARKEIIKKLVEDYFVKKVYETTEKIVRLRPEEKISY